MQTIDEAELMALLHKVVGDFGSAGSVVLGDRLGLYKAPAERFSLSPEQALAFATDDSPASMAGGFQVISAVMRAAPQIALLRLRHACAVDRARPAGRQRGRRRLADRL
jgi:hypothetical protein